LTRPPTRASELAAPGGLAQDRRLLRPARDHEDLNLSRQAKRRPVARSPAFGVALDDLMGYNLRRAHGVQKQRFAAVFGPLGVRPVTLSVLGTLYDDRGITQADLGKRLNIKRANMAPLMAELEVRGFIARRPSDKDRRAHVVTLTPAGLRFTSKVLDLHRRLEDDLARALGLRERDDLLRLLKRFRKLATEPAIDDGDE
jgi:DNA-binding MarR family transcriptional regulator